MIKDVNGINTNTEDGRLALALLAILTTDCMPFLTPDYVIKKANKLIPTMFKTKTKEGIKL